MNVMGAESTIQSWVVFLLWLLPVVTALIGVVIVQVVHVLQDLQAAQRAIVSHSVKLTQLQQTITNGGLQQPVKEAVKAALTEIQPPPTGGPASG